MERERNKITSVCVYCASSTQVASAYREAATELGHLLGERNLRVINGAGNSGLMCAVSDAALAAGGTVTGVIPRFMVEQDWCHKGLTDLVEVDSMHERKQRMADLSDAVIALPGGCGTLEELLEVITWKQLGLYLNTDVILDNVRFYGTDPTSILFWRCSAGPSTSISCARSMQHFGRSPLPRPKLSD